MGLEHSNKNSRIARIWLSRLVKFENYQAETSSEILQFPVPGIQKAPSAVLGAQKASPPSQGTQKP